MITEYEHTQPGWVIRWILGAILLVAIAAACWPVLWNGEPELPALIPAGVLMLCLGLFHSLTVRVTSNDIHLAFGPGLITKSFMIEDVQQASAVRTRWYHGWGIKKIWGGWLFNVSGFDAVQLQMRNGRIYQIGTDEPDQLLAAVTEAIHGAGSSRGVRSER